MCQVCSSEVLAGVTQVGFGSGGFLAISPPDCHRIHRGFSKHRRETRAGGEAVREGMPASRPCPTPTCWSWPRPARRSRTALRGLVCGHPAELGQFGTRRGRPVAPLAAAARPGMGRSLSRAAAHAAAWAPQPFPKRSKLKKKTNPGCQNSAINQFTISPGRSRSLLTGSSPIALSVLPKTLPCRGH